MTMFSVCRRGMAGRQRWCRGVSVGRHAGGTDDDNFWSLSVYHQRATGRRLRLAAVHGLRRADC